MADPVVMGTGSADTVSFLKSATGIVYDGGAGNDAITGSNKDDVIRGGAGADRIMGGGGNDSFVIVAGDLIATQGSANGQNGMLDQIIDFQGAGTNSTSGFQDKLVLYGFSSSATISFEKYVSETVSVDGVKTLVQNLTKHVYKITDPDDHTRDGYIIIQMADGTDKLTADDFVFKAAKIGGTGLGDVIEAGTGVAGVADASGKITAELFDQNTTFKAVAPEALTGKYGSFTFGTDGSWTYHLDDSLDATQHLGRNDVVTETLKVQTVDGTYADITVTVHGTNDAPTVSGQASASVDEGSGNQSIDALANASDVDTGDTLSVITDSLPAGVTYDAATHSFVLDTNNSAYDTLGRNGSTDVVVNYKVSDGLATTDASVKFVVHGVNDAPTVSGQASASVNEGSGNKSIDALANASDVDNGDTLSVVTGSMPAGVTYDAATHSFVLDTNNAAYNSLGRNASTDVVVNYKVSDGLATTDASVKFVVHGTNDAPVTSAINAGTVSEKASPVKIDLLALQSDPDQGDVLSATGITVTDNLGHTVVFTNNGDGTISIDPSQYGALNDGESRTLTVSYGVSDGLATAANTASLKITGVTDYDENHDGDATATYLQVISDGSGDHILRGSKYGDFIYGNGGTDTIYGGAGNDTLDGGPGIDTIWGGSGNDTITGSTGDDKLYGGSGNDLIKGEAGADIIDGGTGDDDLYGGSGGDIFVFRANSGKDTIWDYDNADRIQLTDLGITSANFASHVTIQAHFGYTDVIIDGNAANTITIVGFNTIDKNDFLFA